MAPIQVLFGNNPVLMNLLHSYQISLTYAWTTTHFIKHILIYRLDGLLNGTLTRTQEQFIQASQR